MYCRIFIKIRQSTCTINVLLHHTCGSTDLVATGTCTNVLDNLITPVPICMKIDQVCENENVPRGRQSSKYLSESYLLSNTLLCEVLRLMCHFELPPQIHSAAPTKPPSLVFTHFLPCVPPQGMKDRVPRPHTDKTFFILSHRTCCTQRNHAYLVHPFPPPAIRETWFASCVRKLAAVELSPVISFTPQPLTLLLRRWPKFPILCPHNPISLIARSAQNGLFRPDI